MLVFLSDSFIKIVTYEEKETLINAFSKMISAVCFSLAQLCLFFFFLFLTTDLIAIHL